MVYIGIGIGERRSVLVFCFVEAYPRVFNLDTISRVQINWRLSTPR